MAIAISVGLALVCALAARSSLHSPAVTAAMVGKLVDSPAQRAVAAERSHVSRVAARIADKVER